MFFNRNENYLVNLLWLKYVISFATMHVFRVQIPELIMVMLETQTHSPDTSQ
jgi:hypothetical protein